MQDSSEDFFPKACLPPLFMTVTPHKYHVFGVFGVFGVFVGGRSRMGGFHLSKGLLSAFFPYRGVYVALDITRYHISRLLSGTRCVYRASRYVT